MRRGEKGHGKGPRGKGPAPAGAPHHARPPGIRRASGNVRVQQRGGDPDAVSQWKSVQIEKAAARAAELLYGFARRAPIFHRTVDSAYFRRELFDSLREERARKSRLYGQLTELRAKADQNGARSPEDIEEVRRLDLELDRQYLPDDTLTRLVREVRNSVHDELGTEQDWVAPYELKGVNKLLSKWATFYKKEPYVSWHFDIDPVLQEVEDMHARSEAGRNVYYAGGAVPRTVVDLTMRYGPGRFEPPAPEWHYEGGTRHPLGQAERWEQAPGHVLEPSWRDPDFRYNHYDRRPRQGPVRPGADEEEFDQSFRPREDDGGYRPMGRHVFMTGHHHDAPRPHPYEGPQYADPAGHEVAPRQVFQIPEVEDVPRWAPPWDDEAASAIAWNEEREGHWYRVEGYEDEAARYPGDTDARDMGDDYRAPGREEPADQGPDLLPRRRVVLRNAPKREPDYDALAKFHRDMYEAAQGGVDDRDDGRSDLTWPDGDDAHPRGSERDPDEGSAGRDASPADDGVQVSDESAGEDPAPEGFVPVQQRVQEIEERGGGRRRKKSRAVDDQKDPEVTGSEERAEGDGRRSKTRRSGRRTRRGSARGEDIERRERASRSRSPQPKLTPREELVPRDRPGPAHPVLIGDNPAAEEPRRANRAPHTSVTLRAVISIMLRVRQMKEFYVVPSSLQHLGCCARPKFTLDKWEYDYKHVHDGLAAHEGSLYIRSDVWSVCFLSSDQRKKKLSPSDLERFGVKQDQNNPDSSRCVAYDVNRFWVPRKTDWGTLDGTKNVYSRVSSERSWLDHYYDPKAPKEDMWGLITVYRVVAEGDVPLILAGGQAANFSFGRLVQVNESFNTDTTGKSGVYCTTCPRSALLRATCGTGRFEHGYVILVMATSWVKTGGKKDNYGTTPGKLKHGTAVTACPAACWLTGVIFGKGARIGPHQIPAESGWFLLRTPTVLENLLYGYINETMVRSDSRSRDWSDADLRAQWDTDLEPKMKYIDKLSKRCSGGDIVIGGPDPDLVDCARGWLFETDSFHIRDPRADPGDDYWPYGTRFYECPFRNQFCDMIEEKHGFRDLHASFVEAVTGVIHWVATMMHARPKLVDGWECSIDEVTTFFEVMFEKTRKIRKTRTYNGSIYSHSSDVPPDDPWAVDLDLAAIAN